MAKTKQRSTLGWMHCRKSEDPREVYKKCFEGNLLPTKGRAISDARSAKDSGIYGKNAQVRIIAVDFNEVAVLGSSNE